MTQVKIMSNYTAWIFTLGNEVVQGKVVNTNSAFLGRRLTLLGFQVIGVVSLIDDVDVISRYMSIVLNEKPRIVVTTGGLGPTYDDRTLEAIAKATGKKLILNQEAFEMLKKRYDYYGYELTPERTKMAYLPEGAIPIPNNVGTAPGSWLEVGETIIISLPGVPKEMEVMWITWIEPRLVIIGPGLSIVERTVDIEGVPEALLAPIIKNVLKLYPKIYIKTHPKGNELRKQILELYIMYSHKDKNEASRVVEEVIQVIRKMFKERHGADLKLLE